MNSEEIRKQMNAMATSKSTMDILLRCGRTGVMFAAAIGIWRTAVEILRMLERHERLMMNEPVVVNKAEVLGGEDGKET